MRDYIVSPRVITSRMGNVRQADAPQSPALALARKVNRRGITKLSETFCNYTPEGYISQLLPPLKRIETSVGNCSAVPRSLQCDLLISRSHCNVTRYLTSQKSGEVAC